MDLAETHDLLNVLRSDLLLQKLLVVVNERNDAVFGANVVDVVGAHGLTDVEVDPLADVQLVLIVIDGDQLDDVVCFLADLHDNVILGDIVDFELSVREGQVNYVHQ